MKTYALIIDNTVRELIDIHPGTPPIEQRFHPALEWREVTGLAPAPQPGWAYDRVAGAFTPPVLLSEVA